MANGDCSKCRGLYHDATRSKFNCQWCRNGCQSPVTCDGSALYTCPPPTIHRVLPILSFIHVSDTAFYLLWFSDVGRRLWVLDWQSSGRAFNSHPLHCRVRLCSGAGTNFKVREGHPSAAKRRNFLGGRAPPLFCSKSIIIRFGVRFRDGQYSLFSFLFAVLLLTVPYPRAQPFVKVGALSPVPHGVGATATHAHLPASVAKQFINLCWPEMAVMLYGWEGNRRTSENYWRLVCTCRWLASSVSWLPHDCDQLKNLFVSMRISFPLPLYLPLHLSLHLPFQLQFQLHFSLPFLFIYLYWFTWVSPVVERVLTAADQNCIIT